VLTVLYAKMSFTGPQARPSHRIFFSLLKTSTARGILELKTNEINSGPAVFILAKNREIFKGLELRLDRDNRFKSGPYQISNNIHWC